MRICCSLFVALSLAVTLTMPFASMSKVTSTCGMPRGAGGMPTRSNWPSSLLSAAISRSPWKTRMVTAVWLSSAVENTWLFLVGIVVLRSMSRVNTPPSVSMPSESGVTSRSSTSFTSPWSTPACTAAPMATTSSGLTPLWGSLPKNCFTTSWTFGMRVMPPTSTTSSIWPADSPASFSALRQGSTVFWMRSSTSDSNLARVSFKRQMLRARGVGGDVGQVDLGLGRGRQFDLRLLGRLLEALQGELVLRQVDALLLLELGREIFDEAHVEILAAEEGVAVRRLHLEHAVADLEDRDVESAAAEVIDRDGAGFALVEPVGERRRGRLVDDAQHLEPGDLAGVLGGLTLGVVEIGRDGDHRLRDRLAEMRLRRLLHLRQDEGGDLRGRIVLAVGLDPGVAVRRLDDLVGDERLVLLGHRVVVGAADEALDGEEGALGVGDRLALGRLADEPLAVVREGDDRRRGARAFGILDDLRRRAVHHGHAGIGGAEVDADDFTHDWDPLNSRKQIARPRSSRAWAPPRLCAQRPPSGVPVSPASFAI